MSHQPQPGPYHPQPRYQQPQYFARPPRRGNTRLIATTIALVVVLLAALGITAFVAPGFLLSRHDARDSELAPSAQGSTAPVASPTPTQNQANLTVTEPKAFDRPVDCKRVITKKDVANALPGAYRGDVDSFETPSFGSCNAHVDHKNTRADITVNVGILSSDLTRDFAVPHGEERTMLAGNTAVETSSAPSCAIQVAIHPEGARGFGAGIKVQFKAYVPELVRLCPQVVREIAENVLARLPKT